MVLAYSEMHLTAKVADAVEAEWLAVMDGAPLLVIDEVYYSNQNKAELASSNIYRVDRWDLKLYRLRKTAEIRRGSFFAVKLPL